MKKIEKKKLLNYPKRIVAIFSAGTMMFSLTACRNNKKAEKSTETQIQYCDTSDIRLQLYLDKYVSEYNAGDISNGTEAFTHYTDLYDLLTSGLDSEDTIESEQDINAITYNWDKTEMIYDSVEETDSLITYYANGEEIKQVAENSVQLKTLNGDIEIELVDGSCLVTNTDEVNTTTTILQYNPNGSYTISENTNEESGKFDFNEDGVLVSSEIIENLGSDNEIYKNYKYNNGNMNCYNVYGDYSNLIEKRNEDGSYVIYDNHLDTNRYNFHHDLFRNYSQISYYYDKDDELEHIDVYDEAQSNSQNYYEIQAIFLPNGDYYRYKKDYDENGNVKEEEKTEVKYNKYRNTIINKKNESGETEKITSKFDYTLTSPYKFMFNSSQTGGCIYECVNNIVTIKQKDGIIYKYSSEDGSFVQAYRVEDNGIMYYTEDGKKSYFEKYQATESGFSREMRIEYDKDEQECAIEDGVTRTRYYNYDEKNISSISNVTENEITVEAYGKQYKLGERCSVSFHENGNVSRYGYNSNNIYTEYYETGEIRCSSNDEKIIAYHENGNISCIVNTKEGTSINVAGYELINGSKIYFDENGNVEKYYYDDSYSEEYYKNGKKTIVKDGKKFRYNEDNKVTEVWENPIKDENGFVSYTTFTKYYDYENGQIEKISNYSEDTSVIINDSYGNVYELKENDNIYFRDNGNLQSCKQGEEERIFYRELDQGYYYVKNLNTNTYTFYHNDEIIYRIENGEMNFHMEVTYKNGERIIRIKLQDGTIIDGDDDTFEKENEDIER